MFADEVHPTPFVHLLLARYVSKYMVTKGWL
jgi:phospholipase/lecithinase/hemolysin